MLKKSPSDRPLLLLFDLKCDIELHTDASLDGLAENLLIHTEELKVNTQSAITAK